MHNYKNRMIAEDVTPPTKPMKGHPARVFGFFQGAMGTHVVAQECSDPNTWASKTNERIKTLEVMLMRDEMAIRNLEMKAISELAAEKMSLLQQREVLETKSDALQPKMGGVEESKETSPVHTTATSPTSTESVPNTQGSTTLRDSFGQRCYNVGKGCGQCIAGVLDHCNIS